MIYIDIETGPSPDAAEYAPEFRAPKNIKDPIKIAAAIEEAKAEWEGRHALSAVTGEVLAVGLAFGDSEVETYLRSDSETGLLEMVWDVLTRESKQIMTPRLCGWNICGFDLPFLRRRSWIRGVKPPEWVYPVDRNLSWTHRDLMLIWSHNNPQERLSLKTAAKLFGLGDKLGSGADFAELLKTDPFAAEAYLRRDVELVQAIAKRMEVAK